jgi:hypothetical protein
MGDNRKVSRDFSATFITSIKSMRLIEVTQLKLSHKEERSAVQVCFVNVFAVVYGRAFFKEANEHTQLSDLLTFHFDILLKRKITCYQQLK